MVPGGKLDVSGERWTALYRLQHTGNAADLARKICVEQTIEFPDDLVAPGDIHDHVIGRVESLDEVGDGVAEVVISYPVEILAGELTNLVNVAFGNVSLIPGVRLERLDLSPTVLGGLRGPRFGRAGLRELCAAESRPLVASATKPLGLSSAELAELAYRQALGGIDLIKDDHGLTNQDCAPFRERVGRSVEAVERANRETGGRTLFVANVTAPAGEVHERAHQARELGAGGLMIAPGLTGFDAMRRLADDDALALPVLCHPSFMGSLITGGTSGLSHFTAFGQLPRLAGADVSIFPNFGGRFSFSRDECRSIAAGAEEAMGDLRPMFVAPAGGMTLDSVEEMVETYGRDVVLLIGGALHRDGDLTASCRRFREMAEKL